MLDFRNGSLLDKLFTVGIELKALDAVGEVVGGVWLLLLNPLWLQTWAGKLFAPELREDPHDFFATHAINWVAHFNHEAVIYAAIYLLAHGIVKLVVIVEIMRGKFWAYPGLMVITAAFAAYQIYHMMVVGVTAGFMLITVFDLIIIVLTGMEYRKVRQRSQA